MAIIAFRNIKIVILESAFNDDFNHFHLENLIIYNKDF